MLYSPFNAALERLRLLFKRRVQDAQYAVTGNHDNDGAVVEIPDMDGYVYCRFPDGKDAQGNAKYSPPFPVRSAGAAFINAPGMGVYVAYGRNGELQIVEAHYATLDQAGVDTRVLNPLHQQSQWVYLWQLTIGLCSAVANSVNDSFLVTVKKYRHYVNNIFQSFETGAQADKIDLSAYVPGVDEHRYAGVWVDTYRNAAEVTTSTTQSLFTPLDSTDVQETVNERPPDAIPHKLFYLSNDQGTISIQAASDVDVRQFLNTPQIHGIPNPVAYRERIQPDRQVLFTGSMVVTGSLEVLGSLVGVDSAGGAASSITPGTALFNITADSGGTTSVDQGETVDYDGADGITTTLAGLMLSFAVDNTVIRTTGTQAIAAGLTITSPVINQILDPNGNEVLIYGSTAAATAEITITNGVGIATISGTGTPANIAIEVRPKGISGVLVYGTIVAGTDDTYNIGTTTFAHANIFSHLATLFERTAPSTPSSGFGSTYVKVSPTGQLYFVNDGGVHKQVSRSVAILADSKASGTAGGTSSSTTYNARDLQTEVSDPEGIVTLSSNKFTPVAGRYKCQAYSAFLGGSAASSVARARVQNVTAAATVAEGVNDLAVINSGGVVTVDCEFDANGTDEYRIDTYTTVGRTTNGLGVAVSTGTNEIYTVVILEKVA